MKKSTLRENAECSSLYVLYTFNALSSLRMGFFTKIVKC